MTALTALTAQNCPVRAEESSGCCRLLATLAAALVALSFSVGAAESPLTLTEEQIATLSSLRTLDTYPLYTMTYLGPYDSNLPAGSLGSAAEGSSTWSCSLFAAMDGTASVYGRNFDWTPCPGLLLFTSPPDGYSSVSLVDPGFLYSDGSKVPFNLEGASLEDRVRLLVAPAMPCDGMNDQGLVVGMAAVPDALPPYDRGKRDIHSLGLIREILDHAATLREALAVMDGFNVHMVGGPAIHYLIADRFGHAAVVEFYLGQRVVLSRDDPWLAATNFLLGPLEPNVEGQCWRYDRLGERLTAVGGSLDVSQAMALLKEVSVTGTQWSAVYDMANCAIHVAMGRNYGNAYSFTVFGDALQ